MSETWKSPLKSQYDARLRSPSKRSRPGSGRAGTSRTRLTFDDEETTPRSSPSRSSAAGSPQYGDRFIPMRNSLDGIDLPEAFSLLRETGGSTSGDSNRNSAAGANGANGANAQGGANASQGGASGENDDGSPSMYAMLLRSELLGLSVGDGSPGSSPRRASGSPTAAVGAHGGASSPLSPGFGVDLPPPSTSGVFHNDNLFSYQRTSRRLDLSGESISSSAVSQTAEALLASPMRTQRKVSKVPYKVLDAPSLQDDFYLNLVDWSALNVLAVGLDTCVYLWSAFTSKVTRLADIGPETVTSVQWTKRGQHLAVGQSNGTVVIFDTVKCEPIRTMLGHSQRVCALAWSSSLLSTAGRDRTILNRDLRVPRHFISRMTAHRQEVCGLKWSADDSQLASGGNDNRVFVWNAAQPLAPVLKLREHTAAVKALAWSPHQHGILATGGGTADQTIRIYNTSAVSSNQLLQSVPTGSQVTNLIFSETTSELASCHGYSQNALILWAYPSMTRVATLTGHSSRILYMALSADRSTIVTGAGETLRFWSCFPPQSKSSETTSALQSTMIR